MSRSEALRRLLTFAALSLLASGAVAQSYGDGDQVLTLGAGGFQSVTTTELHVDTDGYINDPGQLLYARVPLLLPDGALIERICLYSRSSIPEVFASATLMEQVLVPSGMGPPVTVPLGMVYSSSAGNGYDYSCSEPLSVTVQTTEPGAPPEASVSYFVHVTAYESLSVGAVEVVWRRQVSPPPATPSFGDVPPSDGSYSFVEALAASGITSGCGGGLYCPDATLTRRQMAVFLAKALGLHRPP